MSGKCFYCVETADRARHVAAELGGLDQSAVILGLTTAAEYALKRIGTNCRHLADYGTLRELDQLGANRQAAMNEISTLIDDIVLSVARAFRDRKLLPEPLLGYNLLGPDLGDDAIMGRDQMSVGFPRLDRNNPD